MSNFIKEASKYFDEKDTNKLEEIYNYLKQIYNADGLYTLDFAEDIAKSIINNRLDIDSAIIGLLYPAYKIKSTDYHCNGRNRRTEIPERASDISGRVFHR